MFFTVAGGGQAPGGSRVQGVERGGHKEGQGRSYDTTNQGRNKRWFRSSTTSTWVLAPRALGLPPPGAMLLSKKRTEGKKDKDKTGISTPSNRYTENRELKRSLKNSFDNVLDYIHLLLTVSRNPRTSFLEDKASKPLSQAWMRWT